MGTITAINDKGKKVYSAYQNKKDYEEIRKLWLSYGYTEISDYEG